MAERTWQADIIPQHEGMSVRGVVWVVADDRVAICEPVETELANAEAAVELLAQSVQRAAGAAPVQRVAVRQERTADALRGRWPDAAILALIELEPLDSFAWSGRPSRPAGPVWIGADTSWPLPQREAVASAAQACRRDDPWRWASPEQLLRATAPSGATWWISFAGSGRSIPSVTLAQEQDDILAEIDGLAPAALTPVVHVTFATLTGPDPEALFTVRGCLAGLLDEEEVAGLADVLRQGARFVARHRDAFRGHGPVHSPLSDSRGLHGVQVVFEGSLPR